MIIGRMRNFSEAEEKQYSVTELVQMAYSEGYEAAQKEFGIVKKTNKAAKKIWEAAEGKKTEPELAQKVVARIVGRADRSKMSPLSVDDIARRKARDIENKTPFIKLIKDKTLNNSINAKVPEGNEYYGINKRIMKLSKSENLK